MPSWIVDNADAFIKQARLRGAGETRRHSPSSPTRAAPAGRGGHATVAPEVVNQFTAAAMLDAYAKSHADMVVQLEQGAVQCQLGGVADVHVFYLAIETDTQMAETLANGAQNMRDAGRRVHEAHLAANGLAGETRTWNTPD